MSEYSAIISWSRADSEPFTDNRYSRGHEWNFDGGVTVPASASPHVVPLPYSVEENVDPEEAFVASLSSCHMLFFLSIAAASRFVVDDYRDNAIGVMEPGDDGHMWMSRVTLRPRVQFSGDNKPDFARLNKMHHKAHQMCFIANSVRTEVLTEVVQTE